jgi:hypothetical protein
MINSVPYIYGQPETLGNCLLSTKLVDQDSEGDLANYCSHGARHFDPEVHSRRHDSIVDRIGIIHVAHQNIAKIHSKQIVRVGKAINR